jgi:hypothetical protein
MREGKEEGERIGTRDYDNATEAQTEAMSTDTSRAKPKLSRKENSKVVKQIEDENKREQESMTHDNANPPQIRRRAQRSALAKAVTCGWHWI